MTEKFPHLYPLAGPPRAAKTECGGMKVKRGFIIREAVPRVNQSPKKIDREDFGKASEKKRLVRKEAGR